MKTLLFLLILFPAVSSAATLQQMIEAMGLNNPEVNPGVGRHEYESNSDLSDWFILHEANAAAARGEEPVIIYHAKDPFDALKFRLIQDSTGGGMYNPKPKIIYEIGGQGRH